MTATRWRDVAGVEDIPDGGVRGVSIAGHFIAVYRHAGSFFATSNVCTHEYALLSEGWIENGEIECPLHGSRFRIEDGRCLGPYGRDLQRYHVRVRAGRIEVELGDEGEAR